MTQSIKPTVTIFVPLLMSQRAAFPYTQNHSTRQYSILPKGSLITSTNHRFVNFSRQRHRALTSYFRCRDQGFFLFFL
jgi:hypothetical protein